MGAPTEASRQVVILGGGGTGRAVAHLVDRLGASSRLADDGGTAPPGLPSSCSFAGPSSSPGLLEGADLVVPSPGVPRDHPVLLRALALGIDVQAEIEFASRRIDAPLAAITGTNGKSTTVTLLAAMLEAGGKRVFVGGNLGRPLAEAVGETWDWVVVEVSSFQLEWVSSFHPSMAALLNLGADHLDRHGDLETYRDTKLRMFSQMDAGDGAFCAGGSGLEPHLRSVTDARLVTFGDAPSQFSVDVPERCVRGPEASVFRLGSAWPVAKHDYWNAAAAVAMAVDAGLSRDEVETALGGFRPLNHRLSLVGEIAGVEFWNDSKATNVDAALASIGAFDGDVILLAGGVSKGASLQRLATGAERIKLVVAYGDAAAQLEDELIGRLPLVRAAGLREAFRVANSQAVSGDTVLLAPSCASFDEFRDYAERGRVFTELVEQAVVEGGGLDSCG